MKARNKASRFRTGLRAFFPKELLWSTCSRQGGEERSLRDAATCHTMQHSILSILYKVLRENTRKHEEMDNVDFREVFMNIKMINRNGSYRQQKWANLVNS